MFTILPQFLMPQYELGGGRKQYYQISVLLDIQACSTSTHIRQTQRLSESRFPADLLTTSC